MLYSYLKVIGYLYILSASRLRAALRGGLSSMILSSVGKIDGGDSETHDRKFDGPRVTHSSPYLASHRAVLSAGL
jgi:hypothetical protein